MVARLADRRIEFHHGKIESQEVFAMADEEQFDEVLEELWVLAEHGEIAEVERMEVHGALPVSLAIEKMMQMGLVVSAPHPPLAHGHKPFVNPCHDALKPVSASLGDGTLVSYTHLDVYKRQGQLHEGSANDSVDAGVRWRLAPVPSEGERSCSAVLRCV